MPCSSLWRILLQLYCYRNTRIRVLLLPVNVYLCHRRAKRATGFRGQRPKCHVIVDRAVRLFPRAPLQTRPRSRHLVQSCSGVIRHRPRSRSRLRHLVQFCNGVVRHRPDPSSLRSRRLVQFYNGVIRRRPEPCLRFARDVLSMNSYNRVIQHCSPFSVHGRPLPGPSYCRYQVARLPCNGRRAPLRHPS